MSGAGCDDDDCGGGGGWIGGWGVIVRASARSYARKLSLSSVAVGLFVDGQQAQHELVERRRQCRDL